MKHFEPDKYQRNKKFLNKNQKVWTFFISKGFKLNIFWKIRPWKKTGTLKDGFRLYSTTAYIDFILKDGRVVRIPPGFIFDGASIPKLAQYFIGKPMGEYALAALLHDWFYSSKILGNDWRGRKEADDIFLTLMSQIKVNFFKRRLMYRAVRFGGGKPYKNNKGILRCFNLMVNDLYNPWGSYKLFPKATIKS